MRRRKRCSTRASARLRRVATHVLAATASDDEEAGVEGILAEWLGHYHDDLARTLFGATSHHPAAPDLSSCAGALLSDAQVQQFLTQVDSIPVELAAPPRQIGRHLREGGSAGHPCYTRWRNKVPVLPCLDVRMTPHHRRGEAN